MATKWKRSRKDEALDRDHIKEHDTQGGPQNRNKEEQLKRKKARAGRLLSRVKGMPVYKTVPATTISFYCRTIGVHRSALQVSRDMRILLQDHRGALQLSWNNEARFSTQIAKRDSTNVNVAGME